MISLVLKGYKILWGKYPSQGKLEVLRKMSKFVLPEQILEIAVTVNFKPYNKPCSFGRNYCWQTMDPRYWETCLWFYNWLRDNWDWNLCLFLIGQCSACSLELINIGAYSLFASGNFNLEVSSELTKLWDTKCQTVQKGNIGNEKGKKQQVELGIEA